MNKNLKNILYFLYINIKYLIWVLNENIDKMIFYKIKYNCLFVTQYNYYYNFDSLKYIHLKLLGLHLMCLNV